MEKDGLEIVIKIALAIATIWTLFYKRAEILGIAHKDYTAKLDSTVRFFKEFFNDNNQKKLILDRASQELARSDYVDYDLISYLIRLHEARAIIFDDIVRLYKLGRKSITYIPQVIVTSECFKLKVKEARSVKKQIFLWGIQYVFFASLFFLPLMFSEYIINTLANSSAPILIYLLCIMYLIATFMMAFIPLLQSTNLRDAETFINKLKKADEKYKEYEELEKIRLEVKNRISVNNVREYRRFRQ